VPGVYSLIVPVVSAPALGIGTAAGWLRVNERAEGQKDDSTKRNCPRCEPHGIGLAMF